VWLRLGHLKLRSYGAGAFGPTQKPELVQWVTCT
jgi:hypothetical protein